MPDLKVPDAIILAGGKGTRLASEVPAVAKVTARVAQEPFVRYIIDFLTSQNVSHIVLSVGHLAEQVLACITQLSLKKVKVDFAIESEPLGTGGAIGYASTYTTTDPILVVNGDTYCDFSLSDMMRFHDNKKSSVTIAVSAANDSSRFGTVDIDMNDEITAFREKNPNHGRAFVNAGAYLISREMMMNIKKRQKFSFENEWLPNLCGHGLFGWNGVESFIDMGTPDSFRQANDFFSQKKLKKL